MVQLKEVARQITLIEQNIYRKIKPWELVSLAWTKKDKSLAPNITTMIQHFNKAFSFYVVLCTNSTD